MTPFNARIEDWEDLVNLGPRDQRFSTPKPEHSSSPSLASGDTSPSY